MAQQASILSALTICNTVFQNAASDRLVDILIPAGYSKMDVTAVITRAKSVVLQFTPPDIRSAALDVLVEAIDNAYTLIVVSGRILAIYSLLMKQEEVTMDLVAGG